MNNTSHNNSQNVPNQINRRKFIKQVGSAALGTGLTLGLLDIIGCANKKVMAELSPESINDIKNYVDGMAYAPLGKTNLMVSRLSLGGDRWDPKVGKRAIEMGVNLVHGSVGYKTMESQVETLGDQWDKFWYVLKHTGKVEDMGKTLDRCLKTIKQDHVEIMAFVVRTTGSTDYDHVKSTFEKLKKAGKVRTLGVTVHTKTVPEVCREVIDADIFDMILTMYQPAKKNAIDKELELAIKKNMGTMSMKTAQGVAKENISNAIATALADGKICTVLKQILTVEELDAYLKVAGESKYNKHSKQACIDPSVCGACGKCLVCPQNIEIQEIMRCATYYKSDIQACNTYREIPGLATVESCINCGKCETNCPRNLSIRHTLLSAHEKWNAIA